MLVALLIGIATVGPMVAYAGVTVVWPDSTKTVDINTSPPITFSQGTDFTTASDRNFASGFSADNGGASYTLTVSGLSGGSVTVDDLVNISKGASVSSFKVKVDTGLSGTLTSPTTLKVRLWTGSTAPTADGDSQVCAVLDLTSAAGTESTNACSNSVKMQLVYELPDASTGSSTVSILPSSIVYA